MVMVMVMMVMVAMMVMRMIVDLFYLFKHIVPSCTYNRSGAWRRRSKGLHREARRRSKGLLNNCQVVGKHIQRHREARRRSKGLLDNWSNIGRLVSCQLSEQNLLDKTCSDSGIVVTND